MNIIKFKDSLRPNDEMFNTHLKGKYAYWVRMRYVVPFSVITPEEYVFCEHDDTYLERFKGKYRDLLCDKSLAAWVDESETENINDVQKYICSNRHTTDPALTINDVKKFRNWIAKELLLMDQTAEGEQKHLLYSEEFTHVLEYYAQGMYDDVIKWLNKYGQFVTEFNFNKSSCGCIPKATDMNSAVLSVCDPINIYRQSIKSKMVEYFGDPDFWIQFPVGFLSEFKAYVDNIIRLNLPFEADKYTNFNDCLCGKSSNQLAAIEILKRLAKALELMVSGVAAGNKNYISDTFRDWARDLYELMYWD